MGKHAFYKIEANTLFGSFNDIVEDYQVKWAITQFLAKNKDKKIVNISQVKEYIGDKWVNVSFSVV